MKVKLIDVGRGKINKVVEVDSVSKILDEVEKYLMSSDVEVKFTSDNEANVVVGGFRVVGKVQVIQ